MTEPIMMVAEPGVNVFEAEDYQKVFDSRLKTLKTKESVTLEPNDAPHTHGLGYIPIHLYAGYLSTKPTRIGWIGQNTPDNETNVIATTTQVSNDSNSEWAASALIYIFWEQLE